MAADALQSALVVGAFGRHCLIETDDGQRLIAHPRGKKNQAVVGDRVLVARVPGPEGDSYLIVDRVRSQALLWLGLAFVVMVLAMGRGHGLMSLLGLGASLLVVVRFIVPGILSGHDPAVIASIGAFVIMGTTLYLAHGVSVKTTVALVGTGVALVATVLLAALAIRIARISGVASEDVVTLQVLASGHVDAAGVFHAKGSDELSTYACFGFVHGRERAFQIDYLRRAAQGRLAPRSPARPHGRRAAGGRQPASGPRGRRGVRVR